MSNTATLSTFAAARPINPIFSSASTISVPAGVVAVLADGRLLTHSNRLVGVFVSPEICIVARPRLGTTDDIILIEQIVGFLHAHEVSVLRLRQRCPLSWFVRDGRRSEVLYRQCVVYWVRTFLADGFRRCELNLPENVIVPDAVQRILKAAAEFWLEVGLIVDALMATDPDLFHEITGSLFRVARWWEFHMLRLLWRAGLEGKPSPDDVALFSLCDRNWSSTVQPLPGYEMLSETICRLL